jgi:hypothetical protein
MCKAGRPPKPIRTKLRDEYETVRKYFVFDPALVRFYHVRNGHGDKTLAVTGIEDDLSGKMIFAAFARRHSLDTEFYGPVGEKYALMKLNKSFRGQINGGGLVGTVIQYKPVLPDRESALSRSLWHEARLMDPNPPSRDRPEAEIRKALDGRPSKAFVVTARPMSKCRDPITAVPVPEKD